MTYRKCRMKRRHGHRLLFQPASLKMPWRLNNKPKTPKIGGRQRGNVGGPTNTLNKSQTVIEEACLSTAIAASEVNGLITLTVASGWEVLLTDGLLSLLGLDEGFGGTWLNAGVYVGDRPVNFVTREMLRVYLEEINTTKNISDGSPSTILASVGTGCHSFGDIKTVRFEHPEFKRLRHGTVSELSIALRDRDGRIIDTHNLPISCTLEFIE